MTADDHEYQASAFVGWNRKRGRAWDEDFEQWVNSKDFRPRDRLAIKRIVVAEMTSYGVAPITGEWTA